MNIENTYYELAKSVFEAMNTARFSDFENNITDDLTLDFPGVNQVVGAKRVILFFNALLRKYTNLTFNVNDVIVQNQKAVVVWTNQGVSKDGADYKNSGMTLFHFEDDKITFISDYFKDTSFLT